MKKRLFALLLAACMALGASPGALAAGEDTAARVVFESTAPDSAGCFTVTMTMYDVTFRVYQFALRYDPAVATPVDQNGTAVDSFGGFAKKDPGTDWISTVGTELNAETGLIDFSGYIMPGTEGEPLDDTSQAVVGSDGLLIYTFYFKKVAEGDASIQVATQEKGEPYRPACPQGVIVAGEDGNVPVTVTFRMAEAVGTGGSEVFEGTSSGNGSNNSSDNGSGNGSGGGTAHSGSVPETPAKTVDELLAQAVFLEIGSHAAVVEGGVTAIYPGEPMVTAYAHDDRTFVPVRFVAERLGAEVAWENDTRTVVIEKGGHTVRMPVGSLTYTLDGVEQTLDVPAELTASTDGNARTMVPVRFVTEALGYQVEWDQPRNLVVIVPGTAEWDHDGDVEGRTMDEALSLLAMYGGFV